MHVTCLVTGIAKSIKHNQINIRTYVLVTKIKIYVIIFDFISTTKQYIKYNLQIHLNYYILKHKLEKIYNHNM